MDERTGAAQSIERRDDLKLDVGPAAWRIDPSSGRATLWDAQRQQRLVVIEQLRLLQPVLDGQPIEAHLAEVRREGQGVSIRFEAAGVSEFCVQLRPAGDCCDVSCRFTVERDCQLNRLDLFPAGTLLNLFDVINFRNRHFSEATWPDLELGRKFETTTYSNDWQFAPHPSLFIFRKGPLHLLAALADVPVATYGMHLAVEGYTVRQWHLDFGAAPHGLALKSGQTFASPRLRLMCRPSPSAYETLDAFAATLVAEGQIPDPASRRRAAWWDEPLYCTWIDQVYKSHARVAADLQLQSVQANHRPGSVLNEELVREVAEVIRRENLPIRTILIDEGWHAARGQWEPHPQRFPNMRRLVDDLHARGLKVMVWLAWPEIFDDAEVPAEFLCGGGEWRNRHGRRFVDYSSPITQEKYLAPLMHRLFSADAGCCDLDGFKTDFQADKIHPETPLADPSWRGEENYLLRITRLFHEQMKRHKPDGMHLGCAGHFWIAPHIDLNRTYDVHSSNWREHEQRALMLRHTAPGCRVSYDFHNFLENLEEWFDSARRQNAAVEIGNLLYVKDDFFAEPRPADADYYRRLRAGLRGPAGAAR